MNSLKKVISTRGIYALNLRVAALLILPLFFFNTILLAQPPAVELHWSPENPEPEDEVTLSFSLGTQANPAYDKTEIDTTFSYSDSTFDISGGDSDTIPIDGDETSWFADDNNWIGYIIVNTEIKTIRLFLRRTDEQPRSGAGLIATGGDVIIIIEEIIDRRGQFAESSQNFSLFPNPSSNYFQVKAKGEAKIDQIHVLTTTGQLLKSQNVNQVSTKVDMGSFPAQTYLLKIIDTDGYTEVKRWVKL